MRDYFQFTLLTKPYIQKYLYAKYGKPIVFSVDNYFGTTILGFLTKKIYKLKETKIEFRKFDQFTTPVEIYFPSYWLRNYKYKTDLTKENVIYLNKNFEDRFEEDLTRHCYYLNLMGVDYKDAVEDFCKEYNIEIDVDISFDCIMKKEYRVREAINTKLFERQAKKCIQPRLF